MFGNSTGWTISAFLAAMMALVMWTVARPPAATSATNSPVISIAMKPIALPVPATTVAPAPTENCDAGQQYRQAVDAYALTPQAYRTFAGHATLDAVKDMPAIDNVLKAANCGGKFSLFSKNPAEVINYNNEQPALDALQQIGHTTITVGMLYNAKDKPDDARAHYVAGFQLGNHLYGERVTWQEMVVGYDLMNRAAIELSKLAAKENDSARVKELDNFAKQQQDYQTKLGEAFKIISAIDENYAGRYAGDIFAIADKAPENMWRVEAIKHLGHYKFNATSRGDQLGARRNITALVNSSNGNPQVHAAAIAARDLTLAQHNMVGGHVE